MSSDFDRLMADLPKIPVTRFLCGSSLAIKILMLSDIVSSHHTMFKWELVFEKFQLWRVFTSFFIGGSGFHYIFDLVILYHNTKELELGPYSRRSADLAYQLLIAAASIFVISIQLHPFISSFSHPFLICILYLSSSLAPPGAIISYMGLFTFPVKYLPHIMIGMDYLIGGPQAIMQSMIGAVVGHIWWWSVWGSGMGRRGGVLAEFSRAPKWMKNLFGEGRTPPMPAGNAHAAANVGGIGWGRAEYNWPGTGRRLVSSYPYIY